MPLTFVSPAVPCIGFQSSSLCSHCTLKYFPKASLSKETMAFFFSHMHLTAFACSRLEAMCTTQGNKLMRGDLWKGRRRGGETDYFLLRPGSLFVVLLLSAASLASVASSHSLEIPPNPPQPSPDDQNLLETCFIWLQPPDDNKVSMAPALLFPLCVARAVVSCFIATSE